MMLTYAGAYLKHKGDYFNTNNDKIEVTDLAVNNLSMTTGHSKKNQNVANSSQTNLYRAYSYMAAKKLFSCFCVNHPH